MAQGRRVADMVEESRDRSENVRGGVGVSGT
jgi:hypothetical protein